MVRSTNHVFEPHTMNKCHQQRQGWKTRWWIKYDYVLYSPVLYGLGTCTTIGFRRRSSTGVKMSGPVAPRDLSKRCPFEWHVVVPPPASQSHHHLPLFLEHLIYWPTWWWHGHSGLSYVSQICLLAQICPLAGKTDLLMLEVLTIFRLQKLTKIRK